MCKKKQKHDRQAALAPGEAVQFKKRDHYMPNETDQVFHLTGDKLIPLSSRPMREGLMGKKLEDALQSLFEKYPQIIPGKQIDPTAEEPPHFVLLRREMPIGGWSLDHLYVDQKNILTLVETKLFQNPESRREVIGQIIEYAASAIELWGGGSARRKATEFWSKRNPPRDLDEVLKQEFGDELDTEDFWRAVEENLKNGRVRLIIATDELRPEIRRSIEYLNNEMQNAEVFGLELKCYGNDDLSFVLVPRLVGQTQSALIKKGTSVSNILWTESKLRDAYRNMSDPELGAKLLRILDWACEKNIFKTAKTKNPTFALQGQGEIERFVSFFSNADIYVFLNEKHYPGAADRDLLVDRLKELQVLDQNVNPQEVASGRNLAKTLNELSEDELQKLLDIFDKHSG